MSTTLYDLEPLPEGLLAGDDDAPATSISRQVLTLARVLRSSLSERLSESDATLPTWALLAALDKDENVSQRQLADECRLEGPTITRHLDRLEARGLVQRQRDRRDRRIVRVRFTPDGKRFYARLERIAEEVDARLLASLEPGQVSALAAVVDQLMAALAF